MAASGCGVGAFVLMTATACAGFNVPPSGPTQPVQSSSESAPAIPDLATLTRQADVVIVGRIASTGTTREVAQPLETPIGPSVGPTRAGESQTPIGGARISIPITTYIVDVERQVRGTTPSGSQIRLTQSGNPIRGAPPTADDVPLAAGERYVLFLQLAADGTFFVAGGVQGRLVVDAQGTVRPVGSGSPATRSHTGQPLDAFLNDVAAVK